MRLAIAEHLHRELDSDDRDNVGEPSAERIARSVFTSLATQGLPVSRVSVGEAPGCSASYQRAERADNEQVWS